MKYLRFKRHLIRNDVEAALFFSEYILIAPHIYPKVRILIYWARQIARLFIKGVFLLKLNKFFRTIDRQHESFLVFSSRENKYKIATDVMFINQDNSYKVKKFYPNKDVLDIETHFMSMYTGKTPNICIPQYKIVEDREISIEFIKERTLLTKIRGGEVKESDLLPLYKKISHRIDELYKNEPNNKCLIHGDLNPSNVLIHNGTFHLIDFVDAHVYEKKFDKFTFLKELLYFYYGHDKYDIISKFFSDEDIDKYRNHYEDLRKRKFHEKTNKF